MTEQAALVTAARAGDPAAQDALVGAHLPLVYNVVGRAMNGSVDVDDVVQDTMLRALNGLGGLRAPERFRSWLLAIAMNQVRAHWEARRRPDGAPVEEATELADPGADFVDLTLVRLQLSGQRQETARATRWLEPDDRGLLSLWWLECTGELSRAEVAEAMGLTPQHTAVRVQRMKAQLEAARVVVRVLESQPPCEELRGLLTPWDGRPSALWRKRIARHARDCPYCNGLWSGLVPAEGLLAGLALLPVAPALLEAVSSGTGMSPAGTASGLAAEGRRARPADDDTTTVSSAAGTGLSRTAARRRKRVRRRAAASAVVAACVAGGGVYYFAIQPDSGSGPGDSTAVRAADEPSATEDRTPRSTPETSTSPSASASRSPSASASRKAGKSPGATPSRTRTAKPSTSAPQRKRTANTTAPKAPSAPTGRSAQVLALVNEEREKAGCGPLTANERLREAAEDHSADMAARDFFDHTNPDGTDPGQRITDAGYRWSTYGENIARGQQTAAAVMDSWMNSPGHRANILNCDFKNLGIGIHDGSGGPWWTQNFGTLL